MTDAEHVSSSMTHRDRALAVLRYQPYDHLPIVHFGFWYETLQRWAAEGHLTQEAVQHAWDSSPAEDLIAGKLGFDFNWQNMFYTHHSLRPPLESKVVASFPDGTEHVQNSLGVVTISMPGAGSIHAEVEHLLKDRASWEAQFKPRLQWAPERVTESSVRIGDRNVPFAAGGLDHLRTGQRDRPLGLHCGSLFGHVRDMLGMEGACYLQADDEPLFDEIINTLADVCYRNVQYALESGARFDFGHFWEDICFRNGPLINPQVFAAKVGPHYRRITALLGQYGLDIVSLDCDGCIDALVPTWVGNGVNTMFPIEVGTWGGNIHPWRKRHGRELRGVGGMNKTVFAHDFAAVDCEVERLKALVELGGYIPCPDHRIAPDAKWDNVRYYCDQMRAVFG